MPQVEIVNRSTMIDKLHAGLVLKPRETAILTIDMHRGHLDPAVATMAAKPEDAKRVIAAARELLEFARERGLPVVHIKLVYRRIPGLGSEGMTQPFWRAIHELSDSDRLTPGRASTVDGHNIMGSPGTEIIPELYREGDYVIDNKKRLDCFYGTDLNQLLQGLRRQYRLPDGHQYQHMRPQHRVHRLQPGLPRGGALRLRRQHVRRGPARARPAERGTLPGLGAG